MNRIKVNLNGNPMMEEHLFSINANERIYLYQYKIGDFYTVKNAKAKLVQSWNSLTRQPDVSEVRVISFEDKEPFNLLETKLNGHFKKVNFELIIMDNKLQSRVTNGR